MKRFISLFLLLSLLLCSCSSPKNSRFRCKLFYFTGEEQTEIVSLETTLQATSMDDATKELFLKLCTPEKKSHISAIPKSVSLLDSSFSDGVCFLTLSPEYSSLPSISRISLNFVLVNAMSSLPGVTQVSISSDGMTNTFTSDDFIYSTPPVYSDAHPVKLYLPSSDYKDVFTVEKDVLPDLDKSFEASVVALLLETPEDTNLISPFPSGTRINKVYVDDGMCILDVSSDFVTSAPHDEQMETAIISSIVDTLTELEGIDSVKFLIDGEPGYGYVYHNLAFPISRLPQPSDISE